MAIKGDNADTVGFKQRHIRDLRQMVGVDEQLELRFELEAVFPQIPRRQRVVACHLLSERRIDDH